MKPAEVIFLIGPPGVGKTTWVKNAGLYRHVVCSTDEIIERKGKEIGLNYTQAFTHFPFKEAENEFKDKIRAAVADGECVIIDRTNMTRNGRRKLLGMFPDTYDKVAMVFDFSNLDEIRRRLKKREEETGKAISEAILQDMIKRYEAPSREDFDTIEYVK